MASKEEHKKQLLQHLSIILTNSDDLRDEAEPAEGPDYDRWDAARNELVAEFARRAP